MKIPLLDLDYQHKPIEAELMDAIKEVIQSNHYILGPKVQELETTIAQYVNARYAVGVSSGSDALLISLMALDVGPGDLVLTTDYSFFATAGAIVRLGATPVLIDIELDTYNIDPDQLNTWFENHPEKIEQVKAIIPVHLYGQSAHMTPILALAKKHGIPVIEDAAQAIGTTYPDSEGRIQNAGSMGDLACFSFFPSKNLGGFGDGGMVTTNNEALYEKLLILRNHGSQPKYYHKIIGGNFRLDALQAAILSVKFNHLETWHNQRRQNAAHYHTQLADLAWLELPKAVWGPNHHIYNQFIIRLQDSINRDAFRAWLQDKDIATEVYYPVPFHEQECFQYLDVKDQAFPNSQLAATQTLALPIYPGMSQDKLLYVVNCIDNYKV